MDKKRITAGSVDELLEIVRAVQRGEDPDIDKIREEQRKKREEQLLERRKKKSQGSAESAEPARASGNKQKKEKEPEPEAENEDFSWPEFDPEKIRAKRNAEPDEEKKPDEDEKPEEDSGKTGPDEPDVPKEDEEKPEDDGRRTIFGLRWGPREISYDDEDEEEPEDEKAEEPQEKASEKEEDFDDDEFERLLNEDNVEEEFIKSKETVTAFTSKVAELLGGLRQKAGGAAARGKEKAGKKKENSDKFPEDFQEIVLDEKAGEESADKKAEAKDAKRKPGAKSPGGQTDRKPEEERAHMRSLERSLSRRYSEDEDSGDDFIYQENLKKPEDSREKNPEKREQDRKDPEKEELRERSERTSDRKRAENRLRLSGQKKEGGFRVSDGITNLLHAGKDRILSGWNALEQKGIHRREMAMLAVVALLVLLVLFFIGSAVRNFFSQKQKSRNVTAEDGLTVTVEDEPQEWASSYPVKLKMSCRTGSISSVIINGVSYTPDENGMLTVETDDWLLQAQAATDDGEKTARIEIPMIDGEAPALDMKRDGDTIVLSAADTRSQVEGIYYAVEDPGRYQQLPLYKKYGEPIKYEEGMTYRFFAKDKAGNISAPVVTTLEDAESFELGQTKISLFPGETCSLNVEAKPAGALLRNLKFESKDTSVAAVEQDGKITAAGEGTTEIHVSAAGMESQTCTVEVSEERTVLVSTIGDCTLGTDESFDTSTNFNAFDAVHGHDYFFRNVKDILGSDDVTFANFEGTLTDSTEREAKQFAFKGDPSYTEILQDGSVEVVTLANNHSRDYGEQSLEDTKEALKEADIDYCTGDEIVIREVNGVQTAFIGIYVLDIGLEVQSQVVQTITRARQLGAKIVIVAFHWGSEKATSPDETQRSLAHTAIDRGADLVVGHHPHVLQGIEQYNGKYIVYSLGNFCFGGNNSPSDMDTIIFQQNFRISQDGTVENGEISVIPCSISSESGYNNYQPTPASGEEAERIIGRLNEYSEEFGQTYTAAER